MSALNVQEFLRKFPKVDLRPVVLFCPGKAGPRARESTFEPLLAEESAAKIAEAFVDESLRDMAYAVFYADETKAGEITLEAQTLPFLSERRVILVRNAQVYESDSAGRAMLHYLQDPADTTLLLLIANSVDRRLKFYKSCERKGLIVECPELTERELGRWVQKSAAAEGKRLEESAVRELLRRAGTHLSDVKNALELVLGYAQQSDVVRESDVTAACADVAEEEVWALTDAIAASQPAAALQALKKLIDLGKQEDYLLGMINWLLKTAYTVAREETASSVSPFLAQKMLPLVRKLGIAKLKAAFSLITDTQFLMRSTGVDKFLALELLVLKLAAPRGGGS